MLHDILLTQKREIDARLADAFIPRTSAPNPAAADLIRVITGPRRAGKSSYAAHLAAHANDEPFGYANFDDERLASLDDYDALLAAIDALYDKPRLIFFDEIQNLPHWELFANRIHRAKRRLILTGSNAHLLGSELATHLTGRHLTLPLLPFSFREYLDAKGAGSAASRTQNETVELCRAYATEGGFPEVVLKDISRDDYLKTLLQAVLFKDIVGRYRIRATRALGDMVTFLLSNSGSEYSYSTLAGILGSRGDHTVRKYLGYLEQTFLLFSVTRFSWKVREQAAFNKKAYAMDNGLACAAGFRFSAGIGKLYENMVAIACHRRQLNGASRLFFWKNAQQEEVDFVQQTGGRVTALIQVCADATAPKTREREMRSLLKASRELRCDNLLLLTETESGEETLNWHGMKGKVTLKPISRWLLEND
ncbi:MAG: ATP-binding protein [Opitutaceae bacterium]|jgi:predicted AAA+ superfamily ATPase|nr:ATP-binding protein [Opitutaceae bacterium]